MVSTINSLTSLTKMNIIRLLDTPKTPDEIALSLNITRQGVDKQLKELQSYGIVEKKWFIGYNRPRVEFSITYLGEKFYRELDEFEEKFRNNGKSWLTEKLKNLDVDLMNGKVSAEKYREQKAEVELTLKWFMVQS
ncbi:MAG: winged helix-turn-helix transcriptional regulator [Cuniculiplasma sp.]